MPALNHSDKDAWEALWDIQYDLQAKIDNEIKKVIKDLSPEWQVAIYAGEIEHLAEVMRSPIVLPPR